MKSLPFSPEIFLNPGGFYFGSRDTRIRTVLGSCVAVTLWHSRLQIGGMCHFMLPFRADNGFGKPADGRYANEAMMLFMQELEKTRTRPAEYEMKLFGGGNMFVHKHDCSGACSSSRMPQCSNIACRNVMTAKALAIEHGFNIRATHLGGSGHRQVIFDLRTGHVLMRHVVKSTEAPEDAGMRVD